jgi:hypothetical protein
MPEKAVDGKEPEWVRLEGNFVRGEGSLRQESGGEVAQMLFFPKSVHTDVVRRGGGMAVAAEEMGR